MKPERTPKDVGCLDSERMWKTKRLDALKVVMKVHLDKGLIVPEVWIVEYNNLVKEGI